MRKAFLVILAVLLLLVPASILGCSSSGSNPPENNAPQKIEYTYDQLMKDKHPIQQVNLAANGTLEVTLAANPSTGYSWEKPVKIADAAIVKETGEMKTIQPTATNVVGAPVKYVWTFQALKAGTSKISFVYSQPWAGGEKGAWTVDITVTVK
jgi:inhibitor of cysteine peptidase